MHTAERSIQRTGGIQAESEDPIEHDTVELPPIELRVQFLARTDYVRSRSKTGLVRVDLHRVKFLAAKQARIVEGIPCTTDKQNRLVLGISLQFREDDLLERDAIGAFLSGIDSEADEIAMQSRAHFRSKRRLGHEGSSFPYSRNHAIVSSRDSEAGRDWYPKQSCAR